MEIINENFIREIDARLLGDDISLHARPFHVASAWMQENHIVCDIFDKQIWGPLMEIYRRLYPSGDFATPTLLTGGVALRDAMYPVSVNIVYGTVSVDPLRCIKISPEELELIFQHYPEQVWRAFYGVCDLWDFGYGVDDLLRADSDARDLLINARSSLVATPRILSGPLDLDAAVQTACLTSELSMKAALMHLGLTESQLKKFSHNLIDLANALNSAKSTPNDGRLRTVCDKFPNYVNSRYSSHGLTRIGLMSLAMCAQFVAAEAIRRVSNRNMAGDMEARRDCNPRPAL